MKLIIILAAAAALAGCMKDPERSSAEEARLMQTSRDWSAAAQSRDLDKITDFYADDAMIITAGQAPVRGKQAIRASLEEAYKLPGFTNSWEPVEANVSGNMGYLLERTRMTMNGPDGAPVTRVMQAVTIWRKSEDGPWKNVVDISVPAPGTPPS